MLSHNPDTPQETIKGNTQATATAASLQVRPLRVSDYADFKEIQDATYAKMYGAWPLKKFQTQLLTYPEGQLCVVDQDRVIGAAFALRLHQSQISRQHTYSQITSNGYLCHHQPKGNVLYGIECVVHPKARRRGVATALYAAREQLCARTGIMEIVFGGRLPGYHTYANTLSPAQYVAEVQKGEREDAVLAFHLAKGFTCAGILEKYQPGDVESKGHAVFLRKSLFEDRHSECR